MLASDPQDTTRYSKLLVADFSANSLQDFDTKFQAWGSSLASIVLEEGLALGQQKLDPALFDVIVTATSFNQKDQKGFLQNVHEILQDGGLVLILHSKKDFSNA